MGKRKFGDHSNGQKTMDWRYELTQFLIGGGVMGRQQTEILKRFMNYARAAELNEELSGLLAQDRVQKFEMPAIRGRSSIRWRATTKMLEPDDG